MNKEKNYSLIQKSSVKQVTSKNQTNQSKINKLQRNEIRKNIKDHVKTDLKHFDTIACTNCKYQPI